MVTLNGNFKDVFFKYIPDNKDNDDGNGILIIKLSNGVESTHIIKNWGYTRIFQYIESMSNLI
jgi:hypothetical protein